MRDASGSNPVLRWLLAALLIGACAGYAIIAHLQLFRVLEWLNYNDFGKFYFSALQWRDGGAMYGPSPATLVPVADGRAEHFWNMNPPHFNVFLLPLTYLSVGWAYAVWTAVNLGVTFIAVRATVRVAGERLPAWKWLIVAVVVVASAPVLAVSLTGQFTGLLIGAVTYIWLRIREERWYPAAVMIGAVCSVKPFLGPLGLVLVARRRWRAAAVSVITAGALAATAAILVGPDLYHQWIEVLRDVRWLGVELNASIFSLFARASSVDIYTADDLTRVSGTLVALAIMAVTFVVMWRNPDPDLGILLAVLTALLASPLGWIYYLPVAVSPLLAMWGRGLLGRPWYVAAMGLWVPHFVIAPSPNRLFAVTVGSIYAWCLLAMWILAVSAAMHTGHGLTGDPDGQGSPSALRGSNR